MKKRDKIASNNSFMYFYSFLITEMADGNGKARLAETTTHS